MLSKSSKWELGFVHYIEIPWHILNQIYFHNFIIIFVFSFLDCSGQQVAVDLWTFGSSYVDLATLSGISKFSGGQVQHFPGYHVVHNTPMAAKFESALRRYFTRKIGFEAVMRIRCTRGLALHTFHGNFFVRSTDLLSLPNINPDAGFGMQVSLNLLFSL